MTSDLKNAITPDEQLDDYEAAPDATDAQMKGVAALSLHQLELNRSIAAAETALAMLKAQLKVNMESDLPLAMSACNMEKLTLTGGVLVEVRKVVAASIPSDKAAEGLAWMEKNAPDLVKHTNAIEFPRAEDKFFKKFLRDLANRKRPVNASSKDYVNPQTLGKFVRDRDKEGLSVPEDILGVFRLTRAVVSSPKMDKNEI
jgi:hypothetical protein